MSCTIRVTFSDEFVYILFRDLKLQELSKYRLDVLRGNYSSITFVEQLKALECLSISSCFLESLEPMERNNMLNKGKVNCVTLMELWVRSLKFIFDVTRSHLVEAEVLKNVPEQSI